VEHVAHAAERPEHFELVAHLGYGRGQAGDGIELAVEVLGQVAVVGFVERDVQVVPVQVPLRPVQHCLGPVGPARVPAQSVKQVEVPSCSTGAVKHAVDPVVIEEPAEELRLDGVVLFEVGKEQIVSLREVFVRVTSHAAITSSTS
jgi:hypothetical protein